jgi:hypothetical protein
LDEPRALRVVLERIGIAGTSSVQELDQYVERKLRALIDVGVTSGSKAQLINLGALSKEPVAAAQVVVSPSDESRLEAARARWKQDFAARSGTVAAVLARFPVDDVPTPRVEGDD